MAIYEIVKKGDEVLRQKAKAVPEITPNILRLLDNMKDTMYDANGVGLAAPQIGISKRIIVVDIGEGPYELINPAIIESEGNIVDSEGCLSIPGLMGDVNRFARVVVTGLDRQGQELRIEAEGYLARAFQHEIDHLEGVLFTDKAQNLHPTE